MRSMYVVLFLASLAPLAVVSTPVSCGSRKVDAALEPHQTRTLQDPVISADEMWVAAEVHSDGTQGSVRVWSTEGDVSFNIERGHSPRISRDSRWVSALQHPEDSTAAVPGKRNGQTLILLDTQDGSRRTFESVLSYDVSASSLWLVYFQASSAGEDRALGTLHVVYLRGDSWLTMENVAEHASHPTTDHYAYVLRDEETGRDSILIGALGRTGSSGIRGQYDGEQIEGLSWAHDPVTIGFLDNTVIPAGDGTRRVSSALYTWHTPGPSRSGEFVRHGSDTTPRALNNPVVSADGAWVAAEERSDRGDGNVRVWSTQSDVTFTMERGHSPRISRDSRWVSALQKPRLGGATTVATPNERAGRTLVMLNTEDGSRRTFDHVLSYDVTHFSSHVTYLQSSDPENDEEPASDNATTPATAPAANDRQVGTLRVAELVSDRVFTWLDVTEYAAHQTIDPGPDEKWKEGYAYVAFVVRDEKTGHETLEIAVLGHAKRGWGARGTFEGEKVEGLRWARDRITLMFLDSRDTSDTNGKPSLNSGLHTWRLTESRRGEFKQFDTQ